MKLVTGLLEPFCPLCGLPLFDVYICGRRADYQFHGVAGRVKVAERLEWYADGIAASTLLAPYILGCDPNTSSFRARWRSASISLAYFGFLPVFAYRNDTYGDNFVQPTM